MARVGVWLWVCVCLVGLAGAAQALDRGRLNDPRPVSEAEMAALLETMVAGKAGVTGIRVEDGDFVFHVAGQNIRMGLRSLSKQINALPDAKQRQAAYDKLVKNAESFISGERQAKSPAEVERFRKALLPVLKNKAYIAQFAAQARKQGVPNAKLLHVPLFGDIIVAAALDLPKITRFLTPGEGGLYGMSDSDVFHTALDNLKRRVDKLQIYDFGGVRMLGFAQADYNASLVILPDPWKSVPNLPRNVAVMIPARDVFAFADADDPGAMADLRSLAKAPDRGFPVSKFLYRLTERGGLEIMP
jgi:hypothetical protein